jgi:hypothetical protein
LGIQGRTLVYFISTDDLAIEVTLSLETMSEEHLCHIAPHLPTIQLNRTLYGMHATIQASVSIPLTRHIRVQDGIVSTMSVSLVKIHSAFLVARKGIAHCVLVAEEH